MITEVHSNLHSRYFITLFFLLFLPFFACQKADESKQPSSLFDFDKDSVADQEDLDDDNDGIPDEIETREDYDGDKIGNNQDRDSDADGIPDLIEATGVDKDGDGVLDPWDEWADENNNGFHDEYEHEPLVETHLSLKKKRWRSKNDFGQIKVDQDNDGIPNFWDQDSDNDGMLDKVEAGNPYLNQAMVDTNADGFDDRLVGHIYTQGDESNRSGHPELSNKNLSLYQTNSSNSNIEGQEKSFQMDLDNTKIPSFLDKNSK